MRPRVQIFSLLALFLAWALSGCGPQIPGTLTAAESACQPGSALILVGDSSLERRCGCQEGAQRFMAPVTGFVCTVATGTIIHVNYDGAFLNHQLVPVGIPSIPPSPIYQRSSSQAPSGYAFTLSSSGTYLFTDNFDPTVNGQLVAL